MLYEEVPPPPGLERVVTRLWFLDAPPVRRLEKILPLPWTHLIVNLSAPYRLHHRDGRVTQVADAFVSGLQDSYLVSECPARLRHVGVELGPVGLHALAPAAAAGTAGRVSDARQVLPGVDELVAGLRPAADDSARATRLLADHLLALHPTEPDPVVSAFLATLDEDSGETLGALSARLGVSHRTLIARFRSVTGTTPKRYLLVRRFHRLVHALQEAGDTPDWAGLAVSAGYYDQPHVVRAFRRFSGWTPVECLRLVREHGPDAAHFVPLDQVPPPEPTAPRAQS